MEINKNVSPYFGAKFINAVAIGKNSHHKNKYFDDLVSFVQIEPTNPDDIEAVKNAALYWKDDKYALNISYAAETLKDNIESSVYALTSQKSNFQFLDSDKILGLMHTTTFPNDTKFIEHIQVYPELINEKNPEYKGVGTGILNSLKQLSNMIVCFPASGLSVKSFYLKNGFREKHEKSNCYVWAKNNI